MDRIFTSNQSWTSLTESAKKYEKSKGTGHTSTAHGVDSIGSSSEEIKSVVNSLHGAVLDYQDEVIKQKKNVEHYKDNMKFAYSIAVTMGLFLMIRTLSPYWINAWHGHQAQS